MSYLKFSNLIRVSSLGSALSDLFPFIMSLTIGGVARLAVGSSWRLFRVQLMYAFFVAGVFVWFVNRAWVPVIDESIKKMPQNGEIYHGNLNWPASSSMHVEGPAGEPFMRLDVQPSGITNVVESVDLVLAFDSKRLLIGSSLGLGLLPVPYPSAIIIPFNKADLEPWWGARSHLILLLIGFLVVILLIATWSFLSLIYMFPVKIFSVNRLSWRSAWQLASAAQMPGALLMILGILMYGLKQIELVGLVFVWVIHLIAPWFYLFFSPFFASKSIANNDREFNSKAKSNVKANPFDESPPSKKINSDNPFGR